MRMTDAAAPAAEATRVCVEAANVVATVPREQRSSSETLEQPSPPTPREEHGDDKTDTQPVKFSKPSTKLKLMRSLAVCEESTPATTPEPIEALQDGFCLQTCQPFDKEEWSTKDETEKENAYDTVDKPRKMLSRDSSQDYTDSTGIDLHEFLVNTLKNNPRDRIMLLKLEQDILDFISNNESQKRKFPPMTSYHRMLLHRVAAYFGMDHNVDPSGKSVIINKTASSRIPDQKFSEHITDDRVDDFQKRYILKRENSSFDRQDSVGDHFVLDKRPQNGEACLSSQQRRHMFSLRGGRSGASRQSSSETEATARYGELRPWSSTDSSDSSNRLAPRPPFTKASSFSGTSTAAGLVRGDSTASSKSTTGRLSKTGSESSSVGSSSSSLSRSQPPSLQLPAPVPLPQGNGGVPGSTPTAAAALPNNNNGEAKASPCHTEVAVMKTGPAAVAALLQPHALSAVAPTATNFYLVPLESMGMPPGATVLVNTHTGLPLVNSDGSAVLYNPAAAGGHAHMVGSRPQQAKTLHHHHHQPTAAQQQPPTANHLLSQPFRSPFQSSSTVPVQYSAVSYPPPPTLPPSALPPPPPPPQFLPVCPNQQYTVPDTLNAQFSHVSLQARQQQQPPGDGGGAPDAHHHHHHLPPAAVYHHHHHHASPSSVLIHGPHHPPPPLQQVAGYVLAGPPGGGFQGGLPTNGGGHPALAPAATPYSHHGTTNPGAHHHGYPSSTVPGAYPLTGPAMNQSFVQQHTYIQQPVPQVTACYCAPANYTQCSGPQQHHYRPSATPLPYNCPPSQHLPQQQAYATLMPNSVPGYQTVMGVQSAANPALAGGQQSNMGSQMQGMMVQYPPMPSYQQVLMPQGSQMVPQQSYQQPVMYACQQGQGVVPVAGMQPCYNLLSPNQHTTMSSTVSFLPAQAVEQLQFPQAASPCVSQQHSGGQQYTGVLPPLPPPPPGGGMVMMQVTVPSSSHQPQRPHSPCQRKAFAHNKYPGSQEPHHRSRRLTEPPPPPLAPLESPQSRVQRAGSPAAPSPVPSPSSPGLLGGLKGLPAGLSAISIMSHHQHQHHHHHLPPAFCPNGQGDGHYPLLGQPLQYKPPMGPPLIHATHMMANHQAHMGIWHGSQGRRTGRKTVATDLSVGEPVSGRILEVTDLPEGISCGEAHRLLGELCRGGAMIKWLSERQPRPAQDQSAAKKQEPPVQELPPGSCKPPRDLASS